MKKNSPDDREQKASTRKAAGGQKTGTSVMEWIVAGISCAALMAVLGYLVVDGVSGSDDVAHLIVLPVEISRTEGGFVVEFSAANRAGKSVAAVEIKGELRESEKVIEEGSVTLDYIPQNSERQGALIFRSDPNVYDLRLSASGYTEP